MPSQKEIKKHIASVQGTQKVTSAMYLIATNKMQRSRAELERTRPYFDALRTEIDRAVRCCGDVDSRYFSPDGETRGGVCAYLAITADKGLAGAYNQNVLKEAERLMQETENSRLFVVGEFGRRFLSRRGIPFERSFLFTAQQPTLRRAREISSLLIDLYDRGEIEKIVLIYTDFCNGLEASVRSVCLLPFRQQHSDSDVGTENLSFTFSPSPSAVIDRIIPGYVTGFIYSALVDSFCSEQNARRLAMDAANKNAQELLDNLSVEYNHVRQGAITREITEISAGARAQKRNAGGEAQS